jgi:hypothetical protein
MDLLTRGAFKSVLSIASDYRPLKTFECCIPAARQSGRQPRPENPHWTSDLLRGMGYSLQANSKTREGDQHIDRNAQFEYIVGGNGGSTTSI